jgi:hypothetical protein
MKTDIIWNENSIQELNIMENGKEVYQELYTSNNSYFFRHDGDKNIIPFYAIIGIRGRPLEEDLVIPITKDYLNNLTLKNLLDDKILSKKEDDALESLGLGNMIYFDRRLNGKLKKTFNQLRDLLSDPSADKEIYSEPLSFGKYQIKGHLIKDRIIDPTESVLSNLAYIEINSQIEGYNNVKQYVVRFKIDSHKKKSNNVEKNDMIRSKSLSRFGPFETPVIDYTAIKHDMMKIPVVKKRIDERKKWLPEYSEDDILFLIFSPIRFLRLKHMQKRLTKDYVEKGAKRAKPSIVKDIRENALFGGVWNYEDLEYLLQIDLLVENGIIVPTDFNYFSPPYGIVYKAVKNGVLIVGGIEHHFKSSKAYKQGHFITYVCNRKMGKEGTHVLLKYRDEIGNTNKVLTCAEMDEEN